MPRSCGVPGMRLSQTAARMPATAIGVFRTAQAMPPKVVPKAPVKIA